MISAVDYQNCYQHSIYVISNECAAEETSRDRSLYVPLNKAALRGDWESAQRFFYQHKNGNAFTANITISQGTALFVAVATGKAIHFVEKMLELTPTEALVIKDGKGNTALHVAAEVGNIEAVKLLVKKNPAPLLISNVVGAFPVHCAAVYAHKETLSYLIAETKTKSLLTEDGYGPFANQYSGAVLLNNLIVSGFFDEALDLLQSYPSLATMILDNGDSPLKAIARKPSAFRSGSRFNFWQTLIYSGVKLVNYADRPNGSDIKDPAKKSRGFLHMRRSVQTYMSKVRSKLHFVSWLVAELVPHIKPIREKKLIHHQALKLVKCLCKEILSLNNSSAYHYHFHGPLFDAARLGIHEVVEEIVDTLPDAIWSTDKESRPIFQVAVIERCENVFNLLYRASSYKQFLTDYVDSSRNTILHLAGKLAPLNKLDRISGAALQMQHELQWFKAVEKFVIPAQRERENKDKKTAAMVFSEEHKQLLIEGGRWMKDTANSCTIAAALIATVVFAAAITVPGGNDEHTGIPNFSKEVAFVIFAVSDAISLFTSTASLIMFLSILTSRYAEEDFLCLLPKRLIIGLVTLFISITSMMVTFGATLYLVFGHKKNWILIPVAALASLPVTLFVSLQFPLLVDMISSTYGSGIFGKQSDRPFY